jgi:hypothetical protein
MAPSSVHGNDSSLQPPEKAAWAIYVYFAADFPEQALQAAVWSALGTLASVGSSKTVKITAMVDLPNRNTEYYIFPQRDPKLGRWPVLPDRFMSNVNSANIDTFVDFFDWSYKNCPAEKIAIICFGHGYALDDYDPRVKLKAGNLHQAFAYNGMARAADSFPGDDGNELRLLYDKTHNAILNNRDFARAIGMCAQRTSPAHKIAVLGLDCCNMAMAEVLSELQHYTEYVVASETALPFQPWLSATVLERFVAEKHELPRDFAVDAVKDFIGSFANSADTYVELSACNLGNFGLLESKMRDLVKALLPAIERYEVRRAVGRAWYHDVSFVPDGLVDLASLCGNLLRYMPEEEESVLLAASEVRDAVKGQPIPQDPLATGEPQKAGSTGGVVDYARTSPGLRGRRISLSTGLSVWFPPWIQFPGVRYMQMKRSRNYLFRGYPNTSFAKATGWHIFLQKLYELTQSKPMLRRQS